MGLETGNYIGDLNPANPTGSDGKSAGDNHLRLIKTVLQECFAGFTGPVLVTGTVGGTGDVITVTPATAVIAYVNRMVLTFNPTAANTGAVTVNISALGAKSLKTDGGASLSAGDLVVGEPVIAVYDGTDFRLLHPTKRYIDALNTAMRTYVDGLAFGTALPNQAGNAGKFVKTDGSNASWDAIDASDITSFSASAAAVRTGTSTTSAMTPGDTYNALAYVTLFRNGSGNLVTTSTSDTALDMSLFVNGSITLGGNITLINPTTPKVGQAGTIMFTQDATGSRTLTVGSKWKRDGGAVALSTAAASVDYLKYEVIDTNTILYDIIRSPS